MEEYIFSVNISYQNVLPYYQGRAKTLVVTTTKGVKVEFPVSHIRQFITSNGINGYFCLKTQNNKFFSLTRIDF